MFTCALALLAAGCGAGTTGPASSQGTTIFAEPTVTQPIGTIPAHPPTIPYVASLTAEGHVARVGQPWRFTVRTHEANGTPVRGTVIAQILSGGAVLDTLGWFSSSGTFSKAITYHEAERGRRLTFRTTIIANGGSRKLDYPVTVK